jgi:putative acetyltransferase
VQLNFEFHMASIEELSRVATEVRVFPLLTLERKFSPHVEVLQIALAEKGRDTEICSVPYEFQRGANQMLRIGKPIIRSASKVANAIIRPESVADRAAVREVNRIAFGGEGEPRLVDALRGGGYARVSLVAEVDSRVVGHILFSALTIATPYGNIEALSLAPMAVAPSHQRRGIGSSLVREGLLSCREGWHRIVIVLGHPEFYSRFGFSAKLAEPLQSPYSGPAFMAIELVSNALRGIQGEVRYPPPFFDL